MPRYLVQGNYTHQGLSGLVASPEDRSGVIKALAESVGGQVISFDYCFGEFDFVGVFEFADNTTMASLVMAVGSAGSITNVRTTVLISVADGFAAAQRAKEMTYRPPGQ
ncbi:MAG: GYD domain-containing protein [Chloroflexi bacterium]|nr:GYD domain-containing protein [Chloroflexota bacterium]